MCHRMLLLPCDKANVVAPRDGNLQTLISRIHHTQTHRKCGQFMTTWRVSTRRQMGEWIFLPPEKLTRRAWKMMLWTKVKKKKLAKTLIAWFTRELFHAPGVMCAAMHGWNCTEWYFGVICTQSSIVWGDSLCVPSTVHTDNVTCRGKEKCWWLNNSPRKRAQRKFVLPLILPAVIQRSEGVVGTGWSTDIYAMPSDVKSNT